MRHVTRKSLMTVAAATGVIAAVGGYAHADSAASGSASNSPGALTGTTVQAPVDVPVTVCGNTVDVLGLHNPATGNACAKRSGGTPGGPGGEEGSGGGYGDEEGSGGGPGGEEGSGGGYGDEEGSGGGYGDHEGPTSSHVGSGGAQAGGHVTDSSGVASGNRVEAPVHVPVNVCGNNVDVVGILNPTMGGDCGNGGEYGTPPGGDQGMPSNPGNPDNPDNPDNPGNPGNQAPGKPTNPGPSSPSGPEGAPSKSEHVIPAGHQSAHSAVAELAHTGSALPTGIALPVGAGALLAGTVLYRKGRASA